MLCFLAQEAPAMLWAEAVVELLECLFERYVRMRQIAQSNAALLKNIVVYASGFSLFLCWLCFDV